tara:strand:+ start:427 stop:687 length:261 start_codon:yes stop_codon:yes gene_type:complete
MNINVQKLAEKAGAKLQFNYDNSTQTPEQLKQWFEGYVKGLVKDLKINVTKTEFAITGIIIAKVKLSKPDAYRLIYPSIKKKYKIN